MIRKQCFYFSPPLLSSLFSPILWSLTAQLLCFKCSLYDQLGKEKIKRLITRHTQKVFCSHSGGGWKNHVLWSNTVQPRGKFLHGNWRGIFQMNVHISGLPKMCVKAQEIKSLFCYVAAVFYWIINILMVTYYMAFCVFVRIAAYWRLSKYISKLGCMII